MRDAKSFIHSKAQPRDSCYMYDIFNLTQQKILENVYKACWRFNLHDVQTLYILNEIAKEF